MKALVFLMSVSVLACCAEDGGMGREGSPVWFMRTAPAEQAAYFKKVCSSYGYTEGTSEMTSCVSAEARTAKTNATSILAQDNIAVNVYN